jgi:hypothetical protein
MVAMEPGSMHHVHKMHNDVSSQVDGVEYFLIPNDAPQKWPIMQHIARIAGLPHSGSIVVSPAQPLGVRGNTLPN